MNEFPHIESVAHALEILENTELEKLCLAADHLRKDRHGNYFDLCSIINFRSGKCSEDCRYCAQSVHHHTDVECYEQINFPTAVDRAVENSNAGIKRISLVTAGRSVSTSQLDSISLLYTAMAEQTDLAFCASMGLLTKEKADHLYFCGVRRYHCNLESCREFFPAICTTHTWDDKVNTLEIAKSAGMDLCSGGIIGMGESMVHRLQLAFELRELHVRSIPINILSPIPSTPLEKVEPISLEDVLRSVAMFRLINPSAVIRIAGGRGRFGGSQYEMFSAGANGAIVGDYLTTSGARVSDDLLEFRKRGFTFTPHDA